METYPKANKEAFKIDRKPLSKVGEIITFQFDPVSKEDKAASIFPADEKMKAMPLISKIVDARPYATSLVEQILS